jgi:hypothetical protein
MTAQLNREALKTAYQHAFRQANNYHDIADKWHERMQAAQAIRSYVWREICGQQVRLNLNAAEAALVAMARAYHHYHDIAPADGHPYPFDTWEVAQLVWQELNPPQNPSIINQPIG